LVDKSVIGGQSCYW